MTISAMKVISALVSFISEDIRIKQFLHTPEFERIQTVANLELPEMALDVIDEALSRAIQRWEDDPEVTDRELIAFIDKMRSQLAAIRNSIIELRITDKNIPS